MQSRFWIERTDGFGILMSGAALGSFLGAMLLANKARTGESLKRVIFFASLGFAVALICFSLSTSFALSTVFAFVIGLFSTTQMSASNSLVQLEVDDSLRGRVLSLWMTFVVGIGPVGGVLVGLCHTLWSAGYHGCLRTVGAGAFGADQIRQAARTLLLKR
ncbi:MAG: MFS transporter [Cyanobacteriota/Melainabacteria group bacterium]